MKLFIILLLTGSISTSWYFFLHQKTHIRKIFIWIDNIIVILLSTLFNYLTDSVFNHNSYLLHIVLSFVLVMGFSFTLIMYRFWRVPKRRVQVRPGEVLSPADGNIIYIVKVEAGNIPVSIKNGLEAPLRELMQTDIIAGPIWLIGINMTPFDVHVNSAPISGKVVLNKHIPGKFLSLKNPLALVNNERNTLVIETDEGEFFGVVQTASKLVRRIDSYVKEGQRIKQGDWFGMIRFGSQVDMVLPYHYNLKVNIGQQVFAKTTTIAYK